LDANDLVAKNDCEFPRGETSLPLIFFFHASLFERRRAKATTPRREKSFAAVGGVAIFGKNYGEFKGRKKRTSLSLSLARARVQTQMKPSLSLFI
jgi:hypothetical protein